MDSERSVDRERFRVAGGGLVAVAAFAAVAATIGDGLLLYVVNAARPELGLAPPPTWALRAGTVLGVVAIPFYALGYRGLAAIVAPAASRRASLVQAAGAIASILGAAIHGLTGRLIGTDLAAGQAGLPPFGAMMAWEGSPLPFLWAGAAILVVVASVSMARGAGEAGVPMTVRVCNPAVLTGVVGVLGLGSELGRSFLVPAAPNIAHALCFTWAARTLARA